MTGPTAVRVAGGSDLTDRSPSRSLENQIREGLSEQQ